MSNLTFILSAALLAVTASAQAAEPKAQPSAPARDSEAAPAAKAQRYCIKETPTGTRIAKKTCKTRSEWIAEGWDPAEPA